MKHSDFSPGFPGELVQIASQSGEPALAFLPMPLPPTIVMSASIASHLERAAIALGRLDNLGSLLPNPLLLIQPFVRREAQASSRIEGTTAEFEQMAILEATPDTAEQNPDYQEVSNYMRALFAGWESILQQPVSAGLLQELHKILMRGVRGQHKSPGEFRHKQVMIDSKSRDLRTARFVPPPPLELRPLLGDLTAYANSDRHDVSALVRIAFVHYQFETIHPFEDGNGRMGRLLIPLLLRQWGILDHPLLYLSEYFERNRSEYVERLFAVSTRNEWNEWVTFVLEGVEHTAVEAVAMGQKLISMRERLRQKYADYRSPNILKIIDSLFERPVLSFATAADVTGLTPPAARAIVRQLEADHVLHEISGRQRGLLFMAREILDAAKPQD